MRLTYPSELQVRDVNANARKLLRAYSGFIFPAKSRVSTAEGVESENRPRTFSAVATPNSFDWRDQLSLPAVPSQGTCNSCTSFAVSAAIEINWLIAHPGNGIQVSPGYLHTCLGNQGETDATEICRTGVDLYRLLAAIQQQGYALDGADAYPFPAASCSTAAANGNISGFSEIGSADEAKAAITVGPIVADMYIWADFFSYTTRTAPSYTPDMTSAGPNLHTICVIGFDANGWIIRNSFGANWGDGTGYATIAYGTCALLGAPPPPTGVSREAYALQV